MRKIKEVVVVEGKTDTATLKQLFDVDTIETSGSGINEDILSLIKTAAQTRGVIVLTDPDILVHRLEIKSFRLFLMRSMLLSQKRMLRVLRNLVLRKQDMMQLLKH